MNTEIIRNLASVAAATTEKAAEDAMSFGERLSFGGQVTVIGVAIVFAVLASLWGVLILFKKLFYDIPEKKKAAAKATIPVAAAQPVAPVVSEAENSTDDTQLIAVITAAIAAYNSEAGASSLPFRVVSYKRVRGANGWSGADENETI